MRRFLSWAAAAAILIAVAPHLTSRGVAQVPPRLEVRTANDGSIVGLSWSPDSGLLASYDSLGTTIIWDSKGEQLRRFHDDDSLVDVAIAGNDKVTAFLLAGETSSTLILRDLAGVTPDAKQVFPKNAFQTVAISASGRYVLLSDGSCSLWDTGAKRSMAVVKNCVGGAFSPTEERMALVMSPPEAKTVTIESRPVQSSAVREWVSDAIATDGYDPRILYSQDGRSLWFGDLHKAAFRRVDAASGKVIDSTPLTLGHDTPGFELPKDFGPFFKYAISPDGRVIAANIDQATGGTNGAFDNTVQLLDFDTADLIAKLERGPRIAQLARVAGDRLLVVDLLGDGYLWDLGLGTEIRRFVRKSQSEEEPDEQNTDTGQSALPSAAMSQDGRYVAIAPYGVLGTGATIWDTGSGAEILTINSDFVLKEDDQLFGPASMEFVGDGSKLVVRACEPATDMLVDMKSLYFLWNRKLPASCGGMAQERSDREMTRSARNGDLILEGKYNDDSSALLDGTNGRMIAVFRGLAAMPVGITPDGKTAILSRFILDKTRSFPILRQTLFVDTSTKLARGKLPFAASAIAVSADGRTTALVDNERIVLADPTNGREVVASSNVGAQVNDVAFSSDGRFVIATTSDGSTRFYDTKARPKLAEICRVFSMKDGNWVVVTPDGRFDTNSIENVNGLVWIAPDDPLRALPIYIFSRQYFEPKLLSRVLKCTLAGNCYRCPPAKECTVEFQPLPSIADVTRVQAAVALRF